jgi:hypothetical protein
MSAPMSPEVMQLRDLDAACAEVREFAGSSGSLSTIRLLDALERVYLSDLRIVKPEGLVALQSCLAQIEKLRATLRGEPGGARV